MRRLYAMTFLATLTASPSVAHAAEWWLVAGDLGDRDAYFVDTDTIARDGAATWFQMLHINRAHGTEPTRMEQVRCGEAHFENEARDAVNRFVCATPEDRASLGAMLGSIPPELTAQMIFKARPSKVAGR